MDFIGAVVGVGVGGCTVPDVSPTTPGRDGPSGAEVGVLVGVAVRVGVGVRVGVAVRVGVGVRVEPVEGVPSGKGDGVGSVESAVGVAVGAAVGVAVGAGVGVAMGSVSCKVAASA